MFKKTDKKAPYLLNPKPSKYASKSQYNHPTLTSRAFFYSFYSFYEHDLLLREQIKGWYEDASEKITEEELVDAERNLFLFMERLVEIDLSQQENEKQSI